MNTSRLKMCWKVERYYSQCGHWATPVVETFCAKGFASGLACADSSVNAESLPQQRGLCPRCAYQHKRLLPGVVLMHRYSDEGPSVPFSRATLNAKPLAMTKEAREKLAQEAADSNSSLKKEMKPPVFSPNAQDLRYLETEETDRQLWEEQEMGKEVLRQRLRMREKELDKEVELLSCSWVLLSDQKIPSLKP